MRRSLHGILGLALALVPFATGCATDGGDDPDEITDEKNGDEDDPAKTEEDGPTGEQEENEEEVAKTITDEPEDTSLVDEETANPAANAPLANETPPPPAALESPSQAQPPTSGWTPNNDGPPPVRVTQADLKLACKPMGAGLTPGYVRYGCNAVRKSDGQHYGIVKGWWHVARKDGAAVHAKDLNFREGGYDMTFDVFEQDAAVGIVVRPGAGSGVAAICKK